jgi:hypothetical protein
VHGRAVPQHDVGLSMSRIGGHRDHSLPHSCPVWPAPRASPRAGQPATHLTFGSRGAAGAPVS